MLLNFRRAGQTEERRFKNPAEQKSPFSAQIEFPVDRIFIRGRFGLKTLPIFEEQERVRFFRFFTVRTSRKGRELERGSWFTAADRAGR